MGIQCFTVERLGEQGGDRMESLLSELEEFVETLDPAPEEESKIAHSGKNYAMKPPCQRDAEGFDWPATARAFLCLDGRKKKPAFLQAFLLWITSGSFRFQFWSSHCRYVFKWLFFLVCPVGVLVKLVGWGTMD